MWSASSAAIREWHPLPLIDAAQLGDLRIGRRGELSLLDPCSLAEQLACALDQQVFAERHEERSRDEASEAGHDDRLVLCARRRDAHHEAQVRNQAICGT